MIPKNPCLWKKSIFLVLNQASTPIAASQTVCKNYFFQRPKNSNPFAYPYIHCGNFFKILWALSQNLLTNSAEKPDNFAWGATDNLSAAVKLNQGILTDARTALPDGAGYIAWTRILKPEYLLPPFNCHSGRRYNPWQKPPRKTSYPFAPSTGISP